MEDPTPEKIPFTVFTNFGIKILNCKSAVGYISIYSSAMNKSIEIQKVINKMNFLMTDIIPKFTEYDFVEHTYTKRDKELLKKYNLNKKPICFNESLIRVEKTERTKPIKITYKKSDLFGKATKRVIKDFNKDPASRITSITEKKYIINEIKKMI